jgi:hypothetical protein
MSRWKRLSLYDFRFTKVSKVYMYIDQEGGRKTILHQLIYCRAQLNCTLYTNGEGLYRLRKNGELLCEGDEFLLACVVARLESALYQSEGNGFARAFAVDGEYAL